MARFSAADPEVNDLVMQVRKKSYPDLERVALATVMAEGAGLPPARIQVPGPALRVAGGTDVLVILDSHRYRNSTGSGRAALVDHGLAAIKATVHPSGRPGVRRRPFDIPGAGYADVLKRHKTRSVEHAALLAIRDASAGLGPDEPPSGAVKVGPGPGPRPGPNAA